MALRWFVLTALYGLALPIAADTRKPEPDPRLSSIYPLTITAGRNTTAVIRGIGIREVRSIVFSNPGLSAAIRSAEAEPAEADQKPDAPAVFGLQIDIAASPDAKAGEHSLRVLTAKGLTNQLTFRVADAPVTLEKTVADPVRTFPLTLNGRLASPGENDAYWIEVAGGESFTFTAISAHPAFDPSISIYEQSGSWFDPNRLNRVAFNDEPLHFPGLSSNPVLVHTFAKPGRYRVQVGAFSGQGGPDYIYELRIARGSAPNPSLRPKPKPEWDERRFTRSVSGDWVQKVSARGGAKPPAASPELFSAVAVEQGADTASLPVMSVPGIVQGRLTKPAEVHSIRLRIDKPQDLAFEIETPEATMPRFNPIVRVLEPGGSEIVTNVHTKLNNNGLYMMKMIQAKVTVSFRNPGEFVVQIRDITTDCAGGDFAYRVLVRPQIPHVGVVGVAEDALSIEAGSTRSLNLTLEREEDFAAPVTFAIEGLPEGMTVVTGVSNPEEKPLLFNGGKMERYTPKTQKTVLLVSASKDVPPMTTPVLVRIVAFPFVNGSLGDAISVKELPLIVLPRSSS